MIARFNIGLLIMTLLLVSPAFAETLHGYVQRGASSSGNALPSDSSSNVEAGTRIQRKHRWERSTDESTSLLAGEEQGNSKRGTEPGNSLRPEDFLSQKRQSYDLETEAGCRELTIAWEAWHKHLARDIYIETSYNGFKYGVGCGGCEYRFTVTRTGSIDIQIIRSWGDPKCTEATVEAIKSMEGNSILKFPRSSKRSIISEESSVEWKRNNTPGYNWKHGDVEKVIVDN